MIYAIVNGMKEFTWHGYTVQVTKKKIKNTNLRIRPEEPSVIRISIPYSVPYDSVTDILEKPKIQRWIEKNRAVPQGREEEKREREPYYRQRLMEVLPGMFAKWEPALGVKSAKVTIRDTKSQWGSCNTRNGNISISVWLGAFPDECIEYVVVHELAHLLEAGHNERFYGILDRHYPLWRQCRERLKNRTDCLF